MTSPCPPTGAMMRRKYSVFLIMISWTVLSVLASLPFILSILSELFFLIFRGNEIPTSLSCTVLFQSFSITFHDAPFFCTNSCHCLFVNGLSPLATRDSLQHCWHKLVVYDSSPSFITTDANCQKLMVFSLHRL